MVAKKKQWRKIRRPKRKKKPLISPFKMYSLALILSIFGGIFVSTGMSESLSPKKSINDEMGKYSLHRPVKISDFNTPETKKILSQLFGFTTYAEIDEFLKGLKRKVGK